MCHEAKTHIFECSPVYYQMVKELRQEMKGADIRVIKEYSDVDKRISATSDFIKKNLLLSPKKFEESREYGNFVTNLMDYNVDCENKGASTVLSGWGHYIIKSRSS
jgi:putative terminase